MSPFQAERLSQVKVKMKHHVLRALHWLTEDSHEQGCSPLSVAVPGPPLRYVKALTGAGQRSMGHMAHACFPEEAASLKRVFHMHAQLLPPMHKSSSEASQTSALVSSVCLCIAQLTADS